MIIIKVVEDFDSGDFNCISCGRQFHLYWNGGELDEHRCCGITYRTEHSQINLVILKENQ